MRIGDLAKATGVDIETIRYYEKAGLLPEPGREANGYRAYPAIALQVLVVGIAGNEIASAGGETDN